MSGAVVAVVGGCVVVVAGARVGGVVVVDNSAESGRVDTFDPLALGGVVVLVFLVEVLVFLFEGVVVEVVLVVANGCVVVVVVLATVVVGPSRAAVFSRAWPRTLIGWSSLYTVTNKATNARRTADRQPNCSSRRLSPEVTDPTLWAAQRTDNTTRASLADSLLRRAQPLLAALIERPARDPGPLSIRFDPSNLRC